MKRYFVIPKESGELCLMSALLGENRDIFFPKLSDELHLISFSDIAVKYLEARGYEPYICESEEEARSFFNTKHRTQNTEHIKWPCLFTGSDTTGEKDFEEFYTDNEILDMNRFQKFGIIKNLPEYDNEKIKHFEKEIDRMKTAGDWTKKEIVDLFYEMIPNFAYVEKGKYLDAKM